MIYVPIPGLPVYGDGKMNTCQAKLVLNSSEICVTWSSLIVWYVWDQLVSELTMSYSNITWWQGVVTKSYITWSQCYNKVTMSPYRLPWTCLCTAWPWCGSIPRSPWLPAVAVAPDVGDAGAGEWIGADVVVAAGVLTRCWLLCTNRVKCHVSPALQLVPSIMPHSDSIMIRGLPLGWPSHCVVTLKQR